MSKLYKSYKNLKQNNSQKIYLFKSGMFYISLQEDAERLSDIFGFKITRLNEEVTKVGFPQNRLDYYSAKLNAMDNVEFEIVDSNETGRIVLEYIELMKRKEVNRWKERKLLLL